jgi:TRAP-type C4-dicarboxylate transport system substrate-binding protein
MKSIKSLLSVLVFGAGSIFGSAQAQTNVMKLATATVNDAQHDWMKNFAARIEKGSAGKIKPEIYPASQLGSNQRMIEGVQFGSIQGYVGPAEFLTALDPRFQVLGAPGLFRDLTHAHKSTYASAFQEKFSELGAARNGKVVASFPTGAYVFTFTKPVSNLAEMAGKKTRVLPSTMQMEQVRALGATPVPMPLGEVLPALQQGALDGAMSTLDVFVPLRYYDTAKYLVDTEQAVLTSVVVLSRKWFSALSPDLQKLVMDSAQKATDEVAKATSKVDDQRKQAWVKAGGVVVKLSDTDRAELTKRMKAVSERVTSKNEGDKALFEVLKKAAE